MEIDSSELVRRASAARDEVWEALEAGTGAKRPAPDPHPPASVIDRAAVLVGMLMDHEPTGKDARVSWTERGNQLIKLHEALRRVLQTTPAGAPAMFSDLRQALARATAHVDAELKWRNEIYAARGSGSGVEAMPFTLRALWSFETHPVGQTRRGVKPTKRAAAEVAREYGLKPRHMALLESALRVDIAPWDCAVLPWNDDRRPYLPGPDDTADERRTNKIVDAWRKVFESLTPLAEE